MQEGQGLRLASRSARWHGRSESGKQDVYIDLDCPHQRISVALISSPAPRLSILS
jgi:hypothetical protein